MCLTIIDTRRPAEPKVCYKVIQKTARISPYYRMAYPTGQTVKAGEDIEVMDYSGEFTNSLKVHNRIYGGVIHVHTDRHSAERDVVDLNIYAPPEGNDVYHIIRVRCLPEHFVALGDFYDAAYTQVEVMD